MALTRISTLAQQNFTLFRLQSLQSRLAETNIQISSGQKARRYSGIATQAKALVNLEANLTHIDGYVANNTLVDNRLQLMETKVSTLFNVASSFRSTLLQGLSGGNANELDLPTLATTTLDQVAGLLNVQEDGRYLFAGSATGTAPVNFKDPDFTAPPNTYPSSPFKFQDAGSGAKSLASQGMAVAFSDTSVSDNQAYRLDYNFITANSANLTLTNLTTGVAQTIDVAPALNAQVANPGDNLAAGKTVPVSFDTLGVTVTLDSNFTRNTDIRTAGTMDASGIGSAGFTNTISTNDANGGVDHDTLSALKALPSSVYDPTTGLLTLTVDNSTPGEVHLSATGVDLGKGVGAPTADLVGAGTMVNVRIGGDVITQLDLGTVSTSGTTNGVLTVDVGNLMFSEVKGGYYQGNAQTLSTRAADNLDVKYGITADAPAFEKFIRALQLVSTTVNNDTTRLEEANRLLGEAIKEMPDIISRIGLSRSTLETASNAHADTKLLVEKSASDIKNVDVTEAIIRLQGDQTALQASFSALAQTRNISLINFL